LFNNVIIPIITVYIFLIHNKDSNAYSLVLWTGRRKLLARIAELEDTAEQARVRAAKLEKDKTRLQIEIRDISIQLDAVSSAQSIRPLFVS